MKNILIACLLALILNSGCTRGSDFKSEPVYNVKKSINLCIEQYQALSGEKIFSEVDRVYAHVANGVIGIVFARGEIGRYGARSSSYKAYLSCGVLIGEQSEIFLLREPMQKSLILAPNEALHSEVLYKSNFKEYFFTRQGDDYRFVSSRNLNIEDFL